MKDEKTITITEEEYIRLLKDSWFLTALEQAGVDNWDGISEAYEIYRKSIMEEQE